MVFYFFLMKSSQKCRKTSGDSFSHISRIFEISENIAFYSSSKFFSKKKYLEIPKKMKKKWEKKPKIEKNFKKIFPQNVLKSLKNLFLGPEYQIFFFFIFFFFSSLKMCAFFQKSFFLIFRFHFENRSRSIFLKIQIFPKTIRNARLDVFRHFCENFIKKK